MDKYTSSKLYWILGLREKSFNTNILPIFFPIFWICTEHGHCAFLMRSACETKLTWYIDVWNSSFHMIAKSWKSVQPIPPKNFNMSFSSQAKGNATSETSLPPLRSSEARLRPKGHPNSSSPFLLLRSNEGRPPPLLYCPIVVCPRAISY